MIQTVLGHSQLTTTRRYTHVPIEATTTAVTGLESGFEAERKKRKEQQEKQEKQECEAPEVKPAVVQPSSTLVQ